MRSEVALLSSNIRISGGSSSDEFGCRVLIAPILESASIVIQNTEISGCGQQGTSHPALLIQGGSNVTLVGSAIHSSSGYGLRVNGSEAVKVMGNVIASTVGTAAAIKASRNARLATISPQVCGRIGLLALLRNGTIFAIKPLAYWRFVYCFLAYVTAERFTLKALMSFCCQEVTKADASLDANGAVSAEACAQNCARKKDFLLCSEGKQSA